MRWILLMIGVFGFCGLVAISYWRQTNVDISPALFILILVVLPSFIVASVYGIARFHKWFKAQNFESQKSVELGHSADHSEDGLTECSTMPWLSVYAVTVQSQLGDHADQIIADLQQFQTAQCDDELWNANGAKLLSRRIDLEINNPVQHLDDENAVNRSALSTRALRIEALTQNIYDELDQIFTTIAEGMTEMPVWQEPNHTQQAILHPAWQGKEDTNFAQDSIVEHSEVWPKQFKVLYLLPYHLTLQDQQYLQQSASEQMLRFGFHTQQVQWIHRITHDADETLQHIEQALTAQLPNTKPTSHESSILLVIGADSNLDQDLIDLLLPENPNLIPSESSFSFLVTHDDALISSLPVLSRITTLILKKRQKPMSTGEPLEVDAINHGFDELRRFYPVDSVDLISPQHLVVTDINPSKSLNLRELTMALSPFDLPAENLIYSGALLESTNVLAPGLALAIAMQHAESAEQHIPVISSAGNILRGLWLAASQPFSKDTREESPEVISRNA